MVYHCPKHCAYCTIALWAFLISGALALGLPQPESDKKAIRIEVQDANGVVIAGPGKVARTQHGSSVTLAFDREYQPGDRIVLSGAPRMMVRLDESMKECSLILAGSPAAKVFVRDSLRGRRAADAQRVLAKEFCR